MRGGVLTVDLRRMRYLINRLPMARFRVDQAMARATRCTASLTGMPRGGGNGSQVEQGAEMLAAARGAYQAIRGELESMRKELAPYVEELEDPLERSVMRMRYMDGYSGREIAYRLTYSERHVFRVLESGEKKVEKMSVMSV